jgi:hypothetical protein
MTAVASGAAAAAAGLGWAGGQPSSAALDVDCKAARCGVRKRAPARLNFARPLAAAES